MHDADNVEYTMKSVTTSAPGKIILCGEHAVVYGKEAVAISLNTTTSCTATILHQQPQVLQINIPILEIDEEFTLKDIQSFCETKQAVVSDPTMFQYDDGVYDELLSFIEDNMKKAALKIIISLYVHMANEHVVKRESGLHMTYNTLLPIGGGLGSSASFAVSTSCALLVLSGTLAPNQNAWTEENYKLLNDWAFQAEKIVHGTPSGIDNSVSTYVLASNKNLLETWYAHGQCLSFKSGKVERLKYLSKVELRVLVVNTKKKRSTKDLVAGVRKRKKMLPEVYSSLMDSIEQVTNAFKKCLQQLSHGQDVNTVYKQIEELVDINQSLLNAIGVGHESIDEILNICSSHNLHGKLTGAGGGGCVFVIVPPSFPVDQMRALQEELNEKFSCWMTSLGGEGVRVTSFE